MEITRHGNTLLTNGQPPKIGAKLPTFVVQDKNNRTVTNTDLTGQTTLISIVPDINTRVCSIQTKHFNADADKIPNIRFVTVSTNTPAQQATWCAAAGVTRMEMLADEKHVLGDAFGIYVASNNTLARSIFIIDAAGTIQYSEIVTEQTNEPNYQAALDFLN
ncbi:2-Cys peroxiredoxin [Loigolactobacillus backii]|uniref:2-Cys peroxiredoxin n=1 Tax=Loigolactobacillus backii TaxID=375175 RepID=A0A192H0G4_9LACO|nr:thiol peroxidase [Loigolactobacillus backii]ANK60701.1 2-Cys peroxiredoxin [Loigolactobacillus backii]ANK61732.1 2-Cys peroxiredoxin [Loigolactobacillus backii]ANK65654.1 2-Cys peroxiredoxin [Loigolactobacillus backii]ANK68131.1 2-Cys peroxiredoxin [Loigolactobacillus backii]ANK69072.1 2-Cys peroxiredoxin [Loigolactobacillus backii]